MMRKSAEQAGCDYFTAGDGWTAGVLQYQPCTVLYSVVYPGDGLLPCDFDPSLQNDRRTDGRTDGRGFIDFSLFLSLVRVPRTTEGRRRRADQSQSSRNDSPSACISTIITNDSWNAINYLCFYRAMHRSAKRGIGIACPSVCPSVTLMDQEYIGRKSWKLIARTVSLTPSFYVALRPSTYALGNMGIFWRDYRWGDKKWHAGAQKRQ